MNVVGRQCARLAQRSRGFTTSSVARVVDEVHPGYKTLAPKKEAYGLKDGTPVHQKGGFFDAILYRATMGACVVAIGWDLKVFYDLNFK